jgi:hypothetical protein
MEPFLRNGGAQIVLQRLALVFGRGGGVEATVERSKSFHDAA